MRTGSRCTVGERNIRYALAVFTAVCVLLPSCPLYAAEDTTVEGRPGAAFGTEEDSGQDDLEIISDYGESSGRGTYGLELTNDQTALSSSVYYDSTTKEYVYITGVGRVAASVMSGMVVTGTVTVSADNSTSLVAYKDGERQTQGMSGTFEESGYYVIQYNDNDGSPQTVLEFTIVPKLTGMIDHYSVPSVFKVTEATYDDAALSLSSEIDMQREGAYHIVYECSQTDTTYTLDVRIDHTAPVLALAAVKNGIAKGPVDISDAEAGATVAITLDGKEYEYREKLTESGDYVVVIMDQAGNYSRYEFTIRIYLDGGAYASAGILLAMIAGVCVYMAIERKRLKVR